MYQGDTKNDTILLVCRRDEGQKKQGVRDDKPRLSWAVAGLRLLAGLPSGGKWARTAYCPQQLVPRQEIMIAGPGPY